MKGLDEFLTFDTGEEIQKLIKSYGNDSPRGAILIAVAQLDRVLHDALKYLFREGRTSKSLLKDGSGLLGGMRARLDVLYAMGYLHKEEFSRLSKMGEVRNAVAHDSELFDFGPFETITLELVAEKDFPPEITEEAPYFQFLSCVISETVALRHVLEIVREHELPLTRHVRHALRELSARHLRTNGGE